MRSRVAVIALPPLLFALAMPAAAANADLGLPIACEMGKSCFVQQFPDLAPGPDVADPWCGPASYDGHDGTDFRVRSMAEVAAGVPVIAAVDGVVAGLRDGVPDRLVRSDADREAVAQIECGNGVLLDSGDGLETQYCHLRRGSVTVTEGQSVRRGDVLGMVGSSGLAQFPHVHLSVRQGGIDIDPSSGRTLTEGCSTTEASRPMWDASVPDLVGEAGALIDIGFAGEPVEHASLALAPPPPPTTGSEAFVGWAWFINLRAGDVVTLRLVDAAGTVLAENTLAPLDRDKADYSAFVGKRAQPPAGVYTIIATVTRAGATIIDASTSLTIE